MLGYSAEVPVHPHTTLANAIDAAWNAAALPAALRTLGNQRVLVVAGMQIADTAWEDLVDTGMEMPEPGVVMGRVVVVD